MDESSQNTDEAAALAAPSTHASTTAASSGAVSLRDLDISKVVGADLTPARKFSEWYKLHREKMTDGERRECHYITGKFPKCRTAETSVAHHQIFTEYVTRKTRTLYFCTLMALYFIYVDGQDASNEAAYARGQSFLDGKLVRLIRERHGQDFDLNAESWLRLNPEPAASEQSQARRGKGAHEAASTKARAPARSGKSSARAARKMNIRAMQQSSTNTGSNGSASRSSTAQRPLPGIKSEPVDSEGALADAMYDANEGAQANTQIAHGSGDRDLTATSRTGASVAEAAETLEAFRQRFTAEMEAKAEEARREGRARFERSQEALRLSCREAPNPAPANGSVLEARLRDMDAKYQALEGRCSTQAAAHEQLLARHKLLQERHMKLQHQHTMTKFSLETDVEAMKKDLADAVAEVRQLRRRFG